jgi:hypothetical protein
MMVSLYHSLGWPLRVGNGDAVELSRTAGRLAFSWGMATFHCFAWCKVSMSTAVAFEDRAEYLGKSFDVQASLRWASTDPTNEELRRCAFEPVLARTLKFPSHLPRHSESAMDTGSPLRISTREHFG